MASITRLLTVLQKRAGGGPSNAHVDLRSIRQAAFRRHRRLCARSVGAGADAPRRATARGASGRDAAHPRRCWHRPITLTSPAIHGVEDRTLLMELVRAKHYAARGIGDWEIAYCFASSPNGPALSVATLGLTNKHVWQ